MSSRKFSLRFTVPPGDNAFVVPWDSTRGILGLVYASEAANPAPGAQRARYDKKKVKYTIVCAGASASFDEQILIGNAGTNADWETQGAQVVLADGVRQAREFKPIATDHRILVTAGGTGPTTFVYRGTIEDTSDYGS
jgi:hypothetical protein